LHIHPIALRVRLTRLRQRLHNGSKTSALSRRFRYKKAAQRGCPHQFVVHNTTLFQSLVFCVTHQHPCGTRNAETPQGCEPASAGARFCATSRKDTGQLAASLEIEQVGRAW
jgi:hypothetical protein